MSKTLTTKEEVIDILISNLNSISRFRHWSKSDREVVEFINAMDEPFRIHHGWVHIREMLKEIDSLPHGYVKEPLRLRAAIIFHDVVCIPCGKDNEEKSAEFASMFYRGDSLSSIIQLILATRHEFPFENYYDDRDLICDLDLVTLGVDSESFRKYRFNIWSEYQDFCSHDDFEKGSKDFFLKLRKQSGNGLIYRTEYFRRKYEDQARKNIDMVLADFGH